MKIIDNRYKIENLIESEGYFKSYKITNLWEDDKIQCLKLYNKSLGNDIINYFIDNFNYLSSIKHDFLLSSYNFKLVKTIDAKKTNMHLYYSTTEYINAPKLSKIRDDLNLEERLRIILDIILTIDFLHFKGFTYKYLNPSNVFVSKDKKIKLTDLATIIEKRMDTNIDENERIFISSEAIVNKKQNDKKVDYHSIGILMKYLLLEDFLMDSSELFVYDNNLVLNQNQKKELSIIINKLIKRDLTSRDLSLVEVIDEINNKFKLNYSYDFAKSRQSLFFDDRIVGREKEINKVISIDDNILNGINPYKAIVLNSGSGIGKTRFISEVSHKLGLKGRDVYPIKVLEREGNDLLDMTNILKQSIKDTPSELMGKYRDELSKILPELRLDINEDIETDLNQKNERFRIYNRIANYFTDLSKDRIIYIIIDDIHNSNSNFIMLLDYLIRNIKSNNILFIFSFNNRHSNKSLSIKEKVSEWKKDLPIKEIEIHRLNVEEIGEMLRNILGISYLPMNFASVLFRESQGNPSYVEHLMKNLFGIGELYINKKGNWVLKVDSYSNLYFPCDIDDALKKQLCIIKESYFEIFKVMSVFGDILYKKTLFNMVNMDKEKLERDLSQLIKFKFIDEKVVDWGYSYAINSMELKRLVYYEIEEDEKIALHKKAANIVSNYDYENIELEMEELLFHLIKSNQSNRAISIIIEKAESLENKYSPHSLFLWERAYNIIKDNISKTKLLVLNNLVDIYFLKGETEKGSVYLEEYQKEATILEDYKHIIKGKYSLVESYYRKEQIDFALEEIENIENISKENNIIEGMIMALSAKARFGIRKGDIKEPRKQLEEALRLSETSGIKTYLGDIYNRLGLNYFLCGRFEDAVENYEKSINCYQADGNYIGATKPMNNIGNMYINNGNVAGGMKNYEKCLKIASKYGFQELEIVFLNNMAEIHIANYEFDKALQYIEKVRKGAIELQDSSMIFLAHINMGTIYLSTGDYSNAYECYIYLKKLDETKKITSMEIITQYNNFLGKFYGFLGKWDEGIEHSKISGDLCKGFDTISYLESRSRIIYYKFLKNQYVNKEEINGIRKEYQEMGIPQYSRKFNLYFSIISLINKDNEYALELLQEDFELRKEYKSDFLEEIREIILLSVNPTEQSINEMIAWKEKFKGKDIYEIKLIFNILLGFKAFSIGFFEQSLRYLLDALDNIYISTLKISDINLKFNYINSRKSDLIKHKISQAIRHIFNKEISYIPLEDITESDLYDYFDISPMLEIISNEDILKITQLNYNDDVIDIHNIEDLISKLTEDFKYNLDLILGYLAKITLANIGYILSYDEKTKKYITLSSVENSSGCIINENILSLASSNKKGALIKGNVDKGNTNRYSEFLGDNIKAIICVPIIVFEERMSNKIDKRAKDISNNGRVQGYIYLETDKVFNKFESEVFEMVSNLSYLIFINMENNALRLISTTDKVTGIFTRQYYEARFDQLINDTKESKGCFTVLMLDIDNFKDVNDNYGHRKGDEVLSLIGMMLKSTVRSTDIVARYGGEEFSILLKNTTVDEAYEVSEKIRENIIALRVQGIEYSITVSIGISSFPLHSKYKEELIEGADQALYYAKEAGKNRTIIWNNQMVNTSNRADKLAGILTGNTNEDSRNILAIMDVIELIKEDIKIEDKIFIFLGRLLETIDAEYASIIFSPDMEDNKKTFTRARFNDEWVKVPSLNYKIIEKVRKNRKGEFLIDWDNIDNLDSLSGLPNWQSVIVLPMIKDEEVKGIIYISVSIQAKEFKFSNFNLSKGFGNIFAAII